VEIAILKKKKKKSESVIFQKVKVINS
jgi:hypothetical protein